MASTLVNFRMDVSVKKELEKVCKELGMNLSTAFNIYARKMIKERRIPFDVSITNGAEDKSDKKSN